MSGQHLDYYSLLGIPRRASAAEVDRAFRRAARATHPDVHPDDSSAADRFKAVSVAYETLGNPERRASYDRTHPLVRCRVGPVEPQRRPAVAPVHPEDELLALSVALARAVGAMWPLP